MSFPRLKQLAATSAVACVLSLSAPLPAKAQTGIVFGVMLSGTTAIPTNTVAGVVCGRLWLDGTNLTYRFAGRGTRSALELRGPNSFETNGPLLFILDPFDSGLDAYGPCEAAAGIPAGPLQPWENPRQAIPLSEGTVAIEPSQIPQLMGGQWYAHSTTAQGGRGRGHRDDTPEVIVPIRGQILPLDSDGDGVPDYLDHCPGTPLESLVNSQGCTLEQLAPCDAPWKNHGAYMNALRQALESFVQEGLLDGAQSRALFESGAQSDCGKRQVIIAPKR